MQAMARCEAVFERCGYRRGSAPAKGAPDILQSPSAIKLQAAIKAAEESSETARLGASLEIVRLPGLEALPGK